MAGVRTEEALYLLAATAEHYINVGVARGPHIAEELAAFQFRQRRNAIAQRVECLAQRRAPELIEGPATVASAVGAPALDAVDAAPGAVFHDFALVLGRKLLKETRVVGELDGD